MMIKGFLTTLRPAVMEDRSALFNWLTASDLTSCMLGPPDFPDNLPPTWDEFIHDYLPHFFDGSKPLSGRCFIIEAEGSAVGQINYNDIYGTEVELDIWMKESQYTGRGYGSDALNTLCHYLHREYQCTTFYIAPSARNQRAVRAYEKTGFKITGELPEHFIPDYEDAVLMKRIL